MEHNIISPHQPDSGIRPKRDSKLLRALATLTCLLLLLVAIVACYIQFHYDHLGPLAIAALFLMAICFLRPKWRWLCLAIVLLTASILCMDAFLFRHHLTVTVRTSKPLMDIEEIEAILTSPSGRTTAYLIGSHWLDSGYWVYISDGHLFPRSLSLDPSATNLNYPRDFQARWTGSVFTISDPKPMLHYQETPQH